MKMENWQQLHIQEHLKDLVEGTKCGATLLSMLSMYLSEDDDSVLEAKLKSQGALQQAKCFYNIVIQRKGMYEATTKALWETNQFAAFLILLNGLIEQQIDNIFGICDIDEHSQRLQHILGGIGNNVLKCNVTFQTHETSLDNTLQSFELHMKHSFLKKLMKESFLVRLINGQRPQLVKNTVPDPPMYYIRRRLTSGNILNPALFKKSLEDIFVFRNIELYEVNLLSGNQTVDVFRNQLKRITTRFIISEKDDDITKIAKISKASVHLIDHVDGRFYHLKTHGSVSTIRDFIHDIQDELNEDGFIRSCLNSMVPVCISDTPGMGKSALLANIAQTIMKWYPKRLVQYIVLREFVSEVEKLKTGDIEKDILIQIIAHQASDTDIGREVVKGMLYSDTLQVDIMLDGFDEVLFNQIKTAKIILRKLADIKSIKLFVATRPHMKNELEDTLSVLMYNMHPFGENEQVKFLTRYWGQQKRQTRNERLQYYAENCLKALQISMNDFEKGFAGIPLQCKLLAEVYQAQAIRYSTPETRLTDYDTGVDIRITSVFELYNKLLTLRFGNFLDEETETTQLKFLVNAHMYASLQLLFPYIAPDFRYILVECFEIETQEIYSLGILDRKQTDNDTPRFFHRTFAEYFIGLFVFRLLQNNTEFDSQLYNTKLFDCFFFDVVLRSTQSSEKLLNSIKSIQETIQTSSFQYPVVCYFINAHLMSNSSAILRRQLTAKPYQLYNVLVATIVQDCAALFIKMVEPKTHQELMAENSQMLPNLLLLAAKYSCLDFLKTISQQTSNVLGKKINYILCRSPRFMITPLHVAVERGHYAITEYILSEDFDQHAYKFLIHCCVSNSAHETEISQKEQILRILASINQNWANEIIVDGIPPALQDNVHVKLLELLAEYGADVNAVNEHGCILHRLINTHISAGKFHETVLFLLGYGFNQFNSVDNEQRTPLHLALCLLEIIEDAVELFYLMKANFNAVDRYGDSILYYAVRAKKPVNIISLVQKFGANLLHNNSKNENVLHICAKYGHHQAFKYFLNSNEIQLNTIIAKNANQLSPFEIAFKFGKGLTMHTIELMETKGLQLTETFFSNALKDLICSKNFMPWEYTAYFVEVADYLIGRGGVLTTYRKNPWELETTKKNKQNIIKSVESSNALLMELEKRCCFEKKIPPTRLHLSSLIVNTLQTSHKNTFELLCISLVACKQIVPYLLLKQCIESEIQESPTFVTTPTGLVNFMLSKHENLVILKTWDMDLSITRIQETINYAELREINDKEIQMAARIPHSALYVYRCEIVTIDVLRNLAVLGQKLICLCTQVDPRMDEYTILEDNITWEDLSSDFQNHLISVSNICCNKKDCYGVTELKNEHLVNFIRKHDFEMVEINTEEQKENSKFMSNTLFHYYIPDKLVFQGIDREELEPYSQYGHRIGSVGDDIDNLDYITVASEQEFIDIAKYTNTTLHLIKLRNGQFEHVRSEGSNAELKRFVNERPSEPNTCEAFPICTCANHSVGSKNLIWNVLRFPKMEMTCWVNVLDIVTESKFIESNLPQNIETIVEKFKSATCLGSKIKIWNVINSAFQLRSEKINTNDIQTLFRCSNEEFTALKLIAVNTVYPKMIELGNIGKVDKYLQVEILHQHTGPLTFARESLAAYFIAELVAGNGEMKSVDVAGLQRILMQDCFEQLEDIISFNWWDNSHYHSHKIQSFKYANKELFAQLDYLIGTTKKNESAFTDFIVQNISGDELVAKWIQACVRGSHFNLIKLFEKIGTDHRLFASEDLVWLAIKYAETPVVKFVTRQYAKHKKMCLTEIRLHCSQSQSVNSQAKNKIVTVLHIAALRGDFLLMEYLMKHLNFRDNLRNEQMCEVIGFCVMNTHTLSQHQRLSEREKIINFLLQTKPQIIQELRNSDASPLLFPKIHIHLILQLLGLGFNLYATNHKSNNILHLCTNYLSAQEYNKLAHDIRASGQINVFHCKNIYGYTPLHSAIMNLEILGSTIELFCSVSLDFNAVTRKTRTPLVCAVISHRSAVVLDSLIRSGADIYKQGYNNRTILHDAAEVGNFTALRYFISQGCDVNATDDHLDTPLHLVAHASSKPHTFEIVQSLVHHGAFISAANKFSYTPVSIASDKKEKQKCPMASRILEFFTQQRENVTDNSIQTKESDISSTSLKNFIVDGFHFSANELFLDWKRVIQNLSGSDGHRWVLYRIIQFKGAHVRNPHQVSNLHLSKRIFDYFLPDTLVFIGIAITQLTKYARFGQKIGTVSDNNVEANDYIIVQHYHQFNQICQEAKSNVHLILYQIKSFRLVKTQGSDKHINSFISKPKCCRLFSECKCVHDLENLDFEFLFQVGDKDNNVATLNISLDVQKLTPRLLEVLNFRNAIELFEVKKLFKKLYDGPYCHDIWNSMENFADTLPNTYSEKLVVFIFTIFKYLDCSESIVLRHVAVNSLFPMLKRNVDMGELETYLEMGLLMHSEDSIVFVRRELAWYFIVKIVVDRITPEFMDLTLSGVVPLILDDCYQFKSFAVTLPSQNSIEIVDTLNETFCFRNISFVNFLELFLKTNNSPLELKNINMNLTPERVCKWIQACITSNLPNLLKLLISFKMHGKLFGSKHLVVLSLKYGDITTIHIVLENYVQHTQDYLPDTELFSSEVNSLSILHLASLRGNYSIMHYLLYDQGLKDALSLPKMQDVLHVCMFETTLLEAHEIYERIRIIDLLAKNYSGLLEAKDKFNRTPLLAPYSHVDLLIHLINIGVNVYATTNENDNILHHCPVYLTPQEYDKLVRHLRVKGYSKLFNCQNNRQEIPLHRAVLSLEILDTTIDQFSLENVDFNARDEVGDTVLIFAVMYQRSLRVLESLVRAGSDISHRDVEYDQTVLHIAASKGNLTAFRYFISLGCDINTLDQNRDTPFYLALRHAKTHTEEIIQSLIKNGADINSVDHDGNSGTLMAVQRGRDKEFLESLIAFGADWATSNKKGYTALHFAAGNGNISAVKLFISLGCNMNATTSNLSTPLHLAVLFSKRNTFEIIQLLSQNGADVNATDNLGKSVLQGAIRVGLDDSILKLIIDSGADWNYCDTQQETALHSAAEFGNLSALKLLIALGCDVNARNYSNYTPIHMAILYSKSHTKVIVEELVKQGGDVNAVDYTGTSPIFHAISKVREESIIKSLIQLGADWTISNSYKYSALHVAAGYDNISALKLFVSLGCDVNAKNSSNHTPIHVAIYHSKTNTIEIVKFLLESGANVREFEIEGVFVLNQVLKRGQDVSVLHALLEFGADLKISNTIHGSVLHSAVLVGEHSALRKLISLGCDVDFRDLNNCTPLQLAVQSTKNNCMEIVNTLLELGGNINASDNFGETVLLSAIKSGREETFLKMLLEYGADWTASNHKNEGVIHYAAQYGNVDAVSLFISFDYDVNMANVEGHTPLYLAFRGEKTVHAVVSHLLEQGADISAKESDHKLLISLAKERVANRKTERRTFDLLLQTMNFN